MGFHTVGWKQSPTTLTLLGSSYHRKGCSVTHSGTGRGCPFSVRLSGSITSLDVSPNYCEMSLASVFPGLCGLAAENKVNSSFSPFVHLGRFGMG